MAAAGKERWSPNTRVIALYNFRGESDEDLSFVEKEILTIVSRTQSPVWWYLARNQNGRQGMIPTNYVKELHGDPVPAWFHGKITRKQSEKLLLSREPGLFLIRESTRYPGDYTLCVCSNNIVEHYRIAAKNKQVTIGEDAFFENLSQLVEHYKQNAHGLCTRLRKPCARHGRSPNITAKVLNEQGWAMTD